METEHSYCNVLDQLFKENNKLANFIIEQCMSSMVTRRIRAKDTEIKITFLLPPKSAVDQLLNMDKESAKQQLKRHIIRYFYNLEKLKTKTIISSTARENFNITTQGDKVMIGNVEVTGELPSSTNGIILNVSGLLEPGIKVQMKEFDKEDQKGKNGKVKSKKTGTKKIGTKKTETKKTKAKKTKKTKGGGFKDIYEGIKKSASGLREGLVQSAKELREGLTKSAKGLRDSATGIMKGGGYEEYINYSDTLEPLFIDHPIFNGIKFYDDLASLHGINLRWNILEHYRRKWPLSIFPVESDYNYYYWLYASLISYMEKHINNFYSIYEPCVDPIIGIELLLQPRLTSNNYLIDDSLLLDWYRSDYWLMADPTRIHGIYNYILGGGSGSGNNSGGGDNVVYIHGSKFERKYIDPFIKSVNKIFDDITIPEQKKRMYLVDTFKEIETGDNFRPNSARKLYKKVDSEYWYLVPGVMQLQSYMIANYHNPLMSWPYSGGRKKKIGDISGGLMYSTSGLNGGAKVITIEKYEPTKFDELMCTFFNEPTKDIIYSILQPNKAKDYRFKLNLFKEFVNSPFFATFDQPKIHTFMKQKKYYVHRNNYNQVGQVANLVTQNVVGPGIATINYTPEGSQPPQPSQSPLFYPQPSSSKKTVTIGTTSETEQQTTEQTQDLVNRFEVIGRKWEGINKLTR